MKKRIAALLLTAALALGLLAVPAAADDEGSGSSAGAPPSALDVYIQVGDDTAESDRLLLGSFSGTQLREWASRDTLKYSAASYYGNTAGRVVREWLPLTEFAEKLSAELGYEVCYASGDSFIMGEDLTRDPDLAGFDRAVLTGNWYSYDSMVGTKRYYFPEWTSGSESGAVEVPSVIGFKSYGGSSGMSDGMLDIYAGSADYLWAFVVYYGQTRCTETNYPYFYYGQTEAAFRYERSAPLNATVGALLGAQIAGAQTLLEETAAADSAADVAQGKYWATAAQRSVLQAALNAANAVYQRADALNGPCFDALMRLKTAAETFESVRQPGEKSGFFWYTETEGDTYVISTANQLWELCRIVNGEAYDENSGVTIAQDSFAGKTVILDRDIDADGARPHIGTEEFAFEGTFDGAGHTVSRLSVVLEGDSYLTDGYYTALFGSIGTQGTVRNLTVRGESGGGSSGPVGGLCAVNAGMIENCAALMTLNAPDASALGGIAAVNRGSVTGCVGVGAPLVGSNSGSAESCIAVSAPLVTKNTGALARSYAIGAAAVGESGGTLTAVYGVGAAQPEGVAALGGAADFGEAVLTELGSAFRALRGGYPALSWQKVYLLRFETILTEAPMDGIEAAEYLPAARPADPAAEGYDFAGWYDDAARSEAADFAALTTGDRTLYAAWTKNGERLYRLTLRLRCVSAPGLITEETRTLLFAAGEEYTAEAPAMDGFACQTPVLTGTMGAADTELTLIYRLYGDLDLDGAVTAADAMLLLRHTAERLKLSAEALCAADVNGDGMINSDDCADILRLAVGLKVGG